MPITTTKNGLKVLLSLLGLGEAKNRTMADVVFAAIGFEGQQHIEQCYQKSINSEFGIATLDARDMLRDDTDKSSSSPISTRELVTDTHNRWVGTIKHFRFVTPERVSIYDMKNKVKECLAIKDNLTSESRPVILIKHGGSELRTMTSLRVTKNQGLQHVQAILDTSQIAAEVMGLSHNQQLGLDNLCAKLGVPCEGENRKFHIAGNDANRILRVLLLLAVQYHGKLGLPCTESQARLISSLREICQEPLPLAKSDLEVAQFISMQPLGDLDDPNAQVDASFFYRRVHKNERHQKAKKQEQDRKQASRELKREPAEDGLRPRDWNAPQDDSSPFDRMVPDASFDEEDMLGLHDLYAE